MVKMIEKNLYQLGNIISIMSSKIMNEYIFVRNIRLIKVNDNLV